MKVYCEDCEYLLEDALLCKAPENRFDSWHTSKHRHVPMELNKNNDCKWWKKEMKIERKWRKHVRNYS